MFGGFFYLPKKLPSKIIHLSIISPTFAAIKKIKEGNTVCSIKKNYNGNY